jgi:3-deoxy-D-manno-octulosonate 8-phosphate phosphatase (KDO 8-P phosphatase)
MQHSHKEDSYEMASHLSVSMDNVLAQLKQITTFVFDVDGVLTDGTVLLLENGLQARKMHIKDGLALQMAMKNGYRVLVISGSYSEPVVKRLQYLGIEEVFMAVKDKKELLEKFIKDRSLQWKEILFMGDDLPDIPVLQKAGVSCCPADAVPEVKQTSMYISTINGGYGCVRDVIEKVLKLNDHWKFTVDITSK